MITRRELLSWLHERLATADFNDYAPNGLQVEGAEKIASVCTAVTASEAVIVEAVRRKADTLIVHHGYFWRGEDPVLRGMKRSRLARLLQHDMNLFAFHLPLDCHPTFGNNACLGRLFEMQSVEMHAVNNTPALLWSGSFAADKSPDVMRAFLTEKLQREPLHVSGNDRAIRRVAWCSGAAQDLIEQAHALGVDAYLSGEISERTYYQAQELGLHYFSCGHHATERGGIEALGNHIAEHFNLQHSFIDSENPV